MSLIDAARGPACVCAAELNRRIRLLCAGRLVWPPAALAELSRLQAAYLDAQRAEAALGARDVA